MFLCDAFPLELIKIGLEADDKDEVFEELVDHFCQVTKNNARGEILEALKERESKMSTGIQKGIAVPHCKTGAVDKIFGILGISKNGIDYDALDGEPVYLIFMVLIPEADSGNQLRLLKRLAELFNNPQFHTELLAQNNPEGANRIIKKHEDIYLASE